jgi:hypothetical protein
MFAMFEPATFAMVTVSTLSETAASDVASSGKLVPNPTKTTPNINGGKRKLTPTFSAEPKNQSADFTTVARATTNSSVCINI